MADTNSKSSQDTRTAAVEATQRAAGAANDAGQRGLAAAGEAARAAGGMAQRGAATAAETARQGGRASAEAVRQGGAALARTGQAAAEVTARGAQAGAEGQRLLAEEAADRFEEMGQQVAEAIQRGTREMRRMMVLPHLAEGGLRDMQQALNGLVEGVVRTNLRTMQEMVRLANPGGVVELQQRFAAEYLGALMEGGTVILQAARRTADEALQPLERQLEARRGQAGAQGGRVADVMSREVRVASPEDTVQQAARLMREEDTGVLPVGENDRLVGMVTDRDLALRVAAEGRDAASTKVREVMTPEVRYVFEDEDLHQAADSMAEQQVRRLPVVNRDRRLVGILSLGDMAREGRTPRLAGRALGGVAREGGLHTQTAAE
ncbi:CBS domain-containing protein [Paracraurococcus lichenis]|uniref:CBS domain-containing protein n=1 Tax=Paracraurococcus lichenis TaxID=3064888 RepID=A0ABT9E4H8_9PROT|nr:CBS domain-containing protein [Paracraurococcus sp. LOR1-02]MDO9711077.1 CBS domain-containing protein [Paracraurococcus sp. LOR1-02]